MKLQNVKLAFRQNNASSFFIVNTRKTDIKTSSQNYKNIYFYKYSGPAFH